MPGRRQQNFIPINYHRVLEFGPGLTVTGSYGGSYRGGKTEITTIDAAGGSTCPLPMTRAALITLRNAGGLSKDCDYVITDHVQGRLVAGTEIHLQAVSASELSENVQVNTTYDNEAWRGVYDIDRGIVLELQDNRNNIARGINGNEVSNFDWGNINITDVTVDNATWTTTYGSPRFVSNVEVKNAGVLTTTTQAGGILNRVVVDNGSTVNLTSANASLINFTATNQSAITLSSFTAGSTLNNWTLSNSVINFSNSTSGVSLSIVDMKGSTINHTGVTTGTITGSNLTMSNNSSINHNNGAGNLALNRVDMAQTGRIIHSAGTIAVSDSEIKDSALVAQNTNAGNISLASARVTTQANLTNSSLMNFNGTRLQLEQSGSINLQAGAGGIATFTSSNISSVSSVSIAPTSTAGNVLIQTSEILNTGIISKSGIGALTLTDTMVNGDSRINVTADRGLNIFRGHFSGLAQVQQNGTGAVVDILSDCIGETRGVYNITSSGAAAHQLSYVRASGLGGNFNISGTSTGQTVFRTIADGSTINLANNVVANTFQDITAMTASTINFQNMTVAKTCSNMQAQVNSTITVNNPTTAGVLQNFIAEGNSTINVTLTAGAGNILTARDGGTLTFNGGSSIRVTKQMFGTLTTGPFTHNNVVVINTTSNTLTANNTGRSSYLGVVSSVPLI